MVSKFIKLLHRDVSGMNQAALMLGIFSIVSQLFGLVRDHLLASLVGPSVHLDVYYAAFRIPDFIYNSFGILFSVTVLIPFIAEYLKEKNEDGESRGAFAHFANNIYSFYIMGMFGICTLVFMLMPYLARLTAPGFGPVAHAELVLFSRIMLISPFVMGLSTLLGSFAQAQKKFFAFAIAPVFYNFGILIGVVVLLPLIGMVGVVLGVILGAVLYFVIQLPTLLALGRIPKFHFNVDMSIIRRVMKTSIPRTIASSLTNLTFIIIGAIASLLAAGSISVFQFSYNIETTPLMVIGISYAVAAFPVLARLHAEGNTKGFLDMVHRAVRNVFFLSIPAALLIIVLRAHIVRVLLGAGNFSWNDTRLVAASLALFSISVTAQCLVLLLVRVFYAKGDTRTPLRMNIYGLIATVVSAVVLLATYHFSYFFENFIHSLLRIEGVTGASVVLLPLAFSVGQTVTAVLLWRAFHRTVASERSMHQVLNKAFFHTGSAGIIAATGAYGTLALIGRGVDHTSFWGILAQGAVAGVIGLTLYAIVLIALKNEDIAIYIDTLRSKFWKQKPMAVEQRDL